MEMITASILQKSHLQALTAEKVVALQVARFMVPEGCGSFAQRLRGSRHLGRYRNAPLIGRAGQAYFESAVSIEDEARYWDHALEWIRDLRASCEPELSPMDKLRLELDELWPPGATIQTLEGRKMFAGLVRVFEDQTYAEAHQDHLEWDVQSGHAEAALKGQFSANIYLAMPPEGGELCLWDRSLSREEYRGLQTEHSYGIDASSLGDPPLRILPEVGDLVIFNARKTHAVRPCRSGQRITWSTFIGYRGPDRPLTLWS